MNQDNIIIQTYQGVGVIQLNRQKALNALSIDMVLGIQDILKQWQDDPAILFVYITSTSERAFCAGGDVKSLYEHEIKEDYSYAPYYLKEQYKMDLMIHDYPKPVISYLHGYVLGGGAGLAMATSLRITSEDVYFGMPEVHIGFFPDVGASYFLPKLSDHVGKYLGVTGKLMNSDDLMVLGITQYKISKERFLGVEETLFKTHWNKDTFEQKLQALFYAHHDPSVSGSVIKPVMNFINKFYAYDRLHEIYLSLKQDDSKEAMDHMSNLDTLCHTSIQITLELLKRGKSMSLHDCFKMEYDLALYVVGTPNFREGVQKVLIEKTGNPKWTKDDKDDILEDQMKSIFKTHDFKGIHPLD
ncbi:MAG: enoyl-CoA hydratase/isomerase family protein [Acholeplasma sp.]|jgi:enoyl-CoA hydratase/carnithine racemase|nr:MAG: enoyl-CoA hydratase/isomerase family protein [Acholeplasma sp.]